jgi:hypothetical protein
MPAYTIDTTRAAQGSDTAEMSTLSDEFGDVSEAVGYSRRMADEMAGMAHQLSLDFDYSNVALYDGDLSESEDLEPDHPAFLGIWVLDDDGASFVPAEEFHAGEPEEDAPEE